MVQPGDRIPEVVVQQITPKGIEKTDTLSLFGTGRTVLFAVPGAFTPTCSMNHLPGFLENRDSFYAKGVNEIAVIAVNDHHVMQAWAKASGGEGKIRFLADGAANFTKALGLDTDLSAGGLGLRSKRYSMLVEDGKVIQLNVEDVPGKAEISGAATLLGQL